MRSALEAVVVALGVRLRRRRFPKQPAQVDEVLLRRGALLQPEACHFAMNSFSVTIAFSAHLEIREAAY